MTTTHRTPNPCPEDVLEWIAWYGEPRLPSDVRDRIDRHAAECLACRQELSWVAGDAELAFEAPDADAVLDQVLGRIRRAEAQGTAPIDIREPRARRPWVAPLAAAAALALLIGGAWLGTRDTTPGLALETAAYGTASGPGEGAGAPAEGPTIEVIFRDDVSWGQVRDLIARAGTSLRYQPASERAGQVQLVVRSGATSEGALAELRRSGLVLFAEPVVR